MVDSIIIRHRRGANPEEEPRRQGSMREGSDVSEEPLPIMRPPRAEFPRRVLTPQEVVEGDIVPNPYTDVDAARANVFRAYGENGALK